MLLYLQIKSFSVIAVRNELCPKFQDRMQVYVFFSVSNENTVYNYTCLNTCRHTYIKTYTGIDIHNFTHTYVCMYIYLYTNACIHTYKHARICTRMHKYIPVHIIIPTYTYFDCRRNCALRMSFFDFLFMTQTLVLYIITSQALGQSATLAADSRPK